MTLDRYLRLWNRYLPTYLVLSVRTAPAPVPVLVPVTNPPSNSQPSIHPTPSKPWGKPPGTYLISCTSTVFQQTETRTAQQQNSTCMPIGSRPQHALLLAFCGFRARPKGRRRRGEAPISASYPPSLTRRRAQRCCTRLVWFLVQEPVQPRRCARPDRSKYRYMRLRFVKLTSRFKY